MRVEATLPDTRGEQLDEVARDLGISRSQLIDEAVAVFLAAYMGVRRGLALALVADEPKQVREKIVTPSFAQVEWHRHRERVTLSADAVENLAGQLASDDEPPADLRRLVRGRRR